MQRLTLLLPALVALLLVSLPTNAALVTRNVTFSASFSNPANYGGGTAPNFVGGATPVNSVSGSFTITFDPTQTYVNDTADISNAILNGVPLGSAFSFNYYPVGSGGSAPFLPDELVIGGFLDGACCVFIAPISNIANDFYLQIVNFTSAPAFQQLGYTETFGSSAVYFYTTSIFAGSVTSTPVGTGTASLVAAVLPSSRSVQVSATATASAVVINAGTGTATGCSVAPATTIPVNFSFQAISPSGAATASLNTPVNIAPSAAQNFVLALTPTASFAPTDVAFTFACANASPAAPVSGVNTLLLSGSVAPVPDIVALVASGDPGILDIPGPAGAGAISVATVNVGASGVITASADTGAASLPLSLSICQTNPQTGQCLSAAAASVTTTINSGSTPTFAVFGMGSGQISFAPATARVFVRFRDTTGATRGSTSVAVRTQ